MNIQIITTNTELIVVPDVDFFFMIRKCHLDSQSVKCFVLLYKSGEKGV